MKQGDKVPVYIAGQVVASAEIKEMDNETATLLVPGTLVVMAVATNIVADEPKEETGQVLLTDPPVGGEAEQQPSPAPVATEQAPGASPSGAPGASETGLEINSKDNVDTTTNDNVAAPQPPAPQPAPAETGE